MSEERELKIAVDDPAALRERLRARGATLVHPEGFEDNEIWDRRGEIRAAGSVLRLRTDARGSRITFKGPPRFEHGVKVRAEHETEVADPEAARGLLAALGYEPERRYQKRRETWRLEGVIVALDRTPMGGFVEFEGVGAARAARRCGVSADDALDEDYLALYDLFRRDHPAAPRDMVFPTEELGDG